MAAKHRKLFPVLEINQTIGCPDGNCDPTCQNGCYPYPYADIFPPSPPPSSKHVLSISPYIIIAVALLASLLLLLGYYLIIVRNCSGWRRRRSSDQRQNGDNIDFLDENRGPVIDHPFWYIRTIGIPPSVISTITVVNYKKGKNLIEGTDCAVCLNEFQDDETLRLLPKCNHAFHVPCIDTWLSSHINCPLCRAPIVSDNSTPPILQNSTANEAILVENNAEGNEEASDNEVGNQENEVRIQESDRGGISGLRRSFSIDSSIAANILGLGMDVSNSESSSKQNSGRNSRVQKMATGGSIEESLHKRPVLMKRSVSYGGRSILCRPNPTVNSILPL